MVRYIAEFNAESVVDFTEITSEDAYRILVAKHEEATSESQGQQAIAEMDKFLTDVCRDQRQVNEDIVRESLPDFLKKHQARRESILSYALKLAAGSNDASTYRPAFWTTPARAHVNVTDSKQSKWYDIVAAASDRLIP